MHATYSTMTELQGEEGTKWLWYHTTNY